MQNRNYANNYHLHRQCNNMKRDYTNDCKEVIQIWQEKNIILQILSNSTLRGFAPYVDLFCMNDKWLDMSSHYGVLLPWYQVVFTQLQTNRLSLLYWEIALTAANISIAVIYEGLMSPLVIIAGMADWLFLQLSWLLHNCLSQNDLVVSQHC